ncbi:nudix (nucleoside diphosphate linked moiety X)-type motif 2 [Chamberlinius hualienensis]
MIRASGLVIYRHLQNEIQYLLLQTSYGHHHWSPPKGHVDSGESEVEAACRETLEEAGLKSQDLDIDWSFKRQLNYRANGKDKSVTYWLALLKNSQAPVLLSDEHIDFKWLPLNEAKSLISDYKDLQQLLSEADVYIRNRVS